MAAGDDLSRIVEDAYAAALDPARWSAWCADLIQQMGGVGGSFVILDAGGARRAFEYHGGTARGLEEYQAGMVALDPQLRYARTLRGSGLFVDQDYIDPDDPATAEFLRWQADVIGWRHHMTGFAALGGGQRQAGLVIFRRHDAGPTPMREAARFARILPHVTRAMELGFTQAEALNDAYCDGLTTGRAEAALLLDEAGRVLRLTPAAEAIVTARRGLDIAAGRVRFASADDDARLQRAIAQAIRPGEAMSGAVTARDPAGRPALAATLHPLPRRHRPFAPVEAAAMLTIVPVGPPQDAPAALYRDALGLTEREVRLAALLVGGHSIESAAAAMAVSIATARFHLRNLLAKAGVTRQIDLLRLLDRLR